MFRLYLPIASGKIEETTVAMEAEEYDLAGRRFLLMDDDRTVRELARRIMDKMGCELELASAGAEAVRIFKAAFESERPFDAVILDLTVPGGMGGKETLEKLLEIDPAVKAVVASGYCNDPVMARFAEHGFGTMVAKPFRINQLSKALYQVLESKDD